MLIFQKTSVFFLLIAVGYFAYKKQYLDQNSCKKLSGIVVNIANPALTISSAISEGNTITKADIIYTFGIAIIIYLILIFIGTFLPKILLVKEDEDRIYTAMFVFSNIGFMGFPLMSAVLGTEAVLLGAAYLIVFNALFYTYGVVLMAPPDEEKYGLKLHRMINSGVVACIVTLIMFFYNIKLPNVLNDAILILANLTTPLSMMIIGASLTNINIKELLMNKKLILFSLFKLLICASIAARLSRFFISDLMISGVTIIVLASPVANLVAMYVADHKYGEKLAVSGVAMTTLMAVFTIPAVFWVCGW